MISNTPVAFKLSGNCYLSTISAVQFSKIFLLFRPSVRVPNIVGNSLLKYFMYVCFSGWELKGCCSKIHSFLAQKFCYLFDIMWISFMQYEKEWAYKSFVYIIIIIIFIIVIIIIIITDIIQKTRLQWFDHIKRMPEHRISKLIMELIPRAWTKTGRPRKTWMAGVQAAMTTRNLERNQWRKREEWLLVSGRRRQIDYYNYYYGLFSILKLLFLVIFSLLLNIQTVKLSVTTVNAHIDARLSAEHHSLSVYI
jgi:hypothetical protein